MSCAHIDEAGAFVLHALEDDEAADYARHLETCEVCSAEVAHLRPVVQSLPLAAPVALPSDALRGRIMAVVESEAELLRAAGPEADRPPAASRRDRERRGVLGWLGGLRPAPLAGLAAALLALAVVAGTLIDGGSSSGPATRTVSAQVAMAGATGEVHITGSSSDLVVADMPQPPKGRVYQVWLKRDGEAPQPTHTLFNVRGDGRADVRITEPVTHADQLLVTAEPNGGSIVPTSKPVLKAQLS
jgi:anti-sigma factor RsiW